MKLRWRLARFFWWIELFSLLILIGFILSAGCAPEVPSPSPTPPPPQLNSIQVLETLGIAEFDEDATQHIINYIDSLPDEGLLDFTTKQKLQETLVLDAFEVSLVSQAQSLRWDTDHPVHVTLEHASQAVIQAPTDTEGTGPHCDEARSIKQGELEGEYIFFYTADYSKYIKSNFTPHDISAAPDLVVTTFYSPFLDNENLIKVMGLDTAARPLQSFAWKMKVDIVAGKSAEEMIQWYEASGFQEEIMDWPKLPSQ